MKIIYNPPDGAVIKDFNFNGNKIETHYPDGEMISGGTVSRGLKQYPDEIADALVETFGFLQMYSEDQAKSVLSRPEAEVFPCDFPGCGKSFTKKIGLIGHKRSHEKEILLSQKPAMDPAIVPIAGVKKQETESVFAQEETKNEQLLPNGKDKDDVEWYGDGVTIENKNQDFSSGRDTGKGHFKG